MEKERKNEMEMGQEKEKKAQEKAEKKGRRALRPPPSQYAIS
jgi:hypothetical protein